MKVRLQFELTAKETEVLVNRAILKGAKREDPTRRWSPEEEKEFVRTALHDIIAEGLRKLIV